jgi:hypothetical protein
MHTDKYYNNCSSVAKMILEWASVLRYTHIACLVISCLGLYLYIPRDILFTLWTLPQPKYASAVQESCASFKIHVAKY